MAQDIDRAEEQADEENATGEKAPRFSKKKKIIAAAGAALLVAGGGTGAMFAFSGDGDGEHGEQAGGHGGEGEGEVAEANYVDVPPMVINLRSSDGQRRFVKLHFMIVPATAEDVPHIEERLPLVIDSYQPFLRELRPEDLAGSAAVYRLKEEMLLRAGEALGGDAVADILIQDLVQQ